jgi:toxin ParE1/3/4
VKLEWTRAAQVDRRGIYDHIETDNPRAATDLDNRFREIAGRLTSFPYLGRLGRVQGTREFAAHRNYVLVYERDGDIVRILRVLHAAQRWP